MKDDNKIIFETNEKILDKKTYGKLIVEIFYLESTLKEFVVLIYKNKNINKFLSQKELTKVKKKLKCKLFKTSKFSREIINILYLRTIINLINSANLKKITKEINLRKNFFNFFSKKINTLKKVNKIRNILCHPHTPLITKIEQFDKEKNSWKDLIFEINEINKKYDIIIKDIIKIKKISFKKLLKNK